MGSVEFTLNGTEVRVDDDGRPLLEVLREDLDVRSPKDGCSPQGQCGCCTVWIDGAPRVACVTTVSRVRGRVVTTLEGLPTAVIWADAFTAAGASQCGFCTPGSSCGWLRCHPRVGTTTPSIAPFVLISAGVRVGRRFVRLAFW